MTRAKRTRAPQRRRRRRRPTPTTIEEPFRAVLSRAPVTLFSQDRALRYIWIHNPQAGLAAGTALGKTDAELLSAEDAARLTRIKRSVLKSGVGARELVEITVSGQKICYDLSVEPQRDAAGRVLGVAGAAVDITDYCRAEQALREHKTLQRLILDNVDEVVYSVAVAPDDVFNSTVQFVSGQTQRILGYAPDAFIHDPRLWFNLLHPDEVAGVEKATRAIAREKKPGIRTYRIRHRLGGEYRRIEDKIVPQLDNSGRVVGFVGVARDVTDSQRAEEQARASREELRRLSARARLAREEERSRLARDLHDELGQALTGLTMDLAWLDARLTECAEETALALRGKITAMSQVIDATIQSVRRISTELRPAVLDRLGLLAALEWQAEDFERRTGVRCRFRARVAKLELSPGHATEVFRIVQEALTNVARHASASRASVSVTRDEEAMIVEVRDNGRGITREEMEGPGTFGLLSMRERTFLLGGALTIARAGRKGTVVTLRIPLVRQDNVQPVGGAEHRSRTERGASPKAERG